MKSEKTFEFWVPKIMFCCVIVAIILLAIHPHSESKPEFLSASEYESIEGYIANAAEQQTALAKIVDSRELSEEELKLFDEAILKLGESVDALENILKVKELK